MAKKHIGKNCKKCNTYLTEDNCASNTQKLCKPCYNAQMRQYFQKYKDKHREIMYRWRANNKDKVKAMLVDYGTRKFGSLNKCLTYYQAKCKKDLTDGYIRFTLIQHEYGNLKAADIPNELINLKRTQLLLKRKIQSNG
jgi:hypothetical protein